MKNRFVAAILAFFFGSFGVHIFYLGRNTTGILYLCFCWTGLPWLLSMIDIFSLLITDDRTFDLRYNAEYLYGLNGPIATHERIIESTPVASAPKESAKSKAAQIKELKELMVQGAIDEDEFERLKADILKS